MNSIGIQLRISDFLFAVQKRWKIIASLTFLGLVFGMLLSGMNYVQSAARTYQIDGSFVVNAVDSQGRFSGNSIAPNRTDMTMATEMYDTVYYLLRSDRLLYKIINDQQLLGISASDIRNGLSISQYNNTNILTMRLTWDNNEEGLMLWQAIIDAANVLLPQIMQVGRLQIFNEPESRLISSRSANIKTWMVLPVLGFGAGMGFAIIELLMRPTLINIKDIETVFGLETIGIIPYDAEFFTQKSSLLVADENSSSEVTQNFSSASYILRNRIGFKESCHCFYVTSTTYQEGRTSVAANLAIQLSDMERNTLLIDFDYKNPTLGSLFLNNLDYNRSLNALYRGEINLTDAITTLTGHLDILPMVMEHNLIYLDSAIIEFINQLRTQYQYIIIDAPPVGKVSETLSLNQVANTVLFVVRYDTASIPEIQASLEKLEKSGIRIMGCIVNGLKSTKAMLLGTSKEENAKKAKTTASRKKKKKTLIGSKKEENKNEAAELRDLTSQTKGKKQKHGKKSAKKEAPVKPEFFTAVPKTEKAAQPPVPPEIIDGIPPADTAVSTEAQTGYQQGPLSPKVEPPAKTEPGYRDEPPVYVTEGPAEVQPEMNVESPGVSTEKESEQKTEDQPEFLDGGGKQENAESGALLPDGADGFAFREEPEPIASAGEVIVIDAPPAEAIPEAEPETPRTAPKKQGLFGRSSKPKKEASPKKKKEALPKKESSGAREAVPTKGKKVKAEPEKKKGTGLSFWGKSKKKEEFTFDPVKTEAAVIRKSRNVFEDLMDDKPIEQASRTDADMMEELLRMGLDGSWTQPSEAKSEYKEKPKSGKRNLFDDL